MLALIFITFLMDAQTHKLFSDEEVSQSLGDSKQPFALSLLAFFPILLMTHPR